MKYLDTGFPEPGATAVWGDAAVWVPVGAVDRLRHTSRPCATRTR